jgi:WD40 repeat protein
MRVNRTQEFLMQNHRPELIPIGHSCPVGSLAFSADGKTLISGGSDDEEILWDVPTGAMLRLIRWEDYVNGQIVAPDGRTVLTSDGEVWSSPDRIPSQRRRRRGYRMACAPDDRTVAAVYGIPGTEEHQIRVFDARTGRTKRLFACGEYFPHSLAFSADGKLVAASGFCFQPNWYHYSAE